MKPPVSRISPQVLNHMFGRSFSTIASGELQVSLTCSFAHSSLDFFSAERGIGHGLCSLMSWSVSILAAIHIRICGQILLGLSGFSVIQIFRH